MEAVTVSLTAARPGDLCSGFRLVKKQHVDSQNGDSYTLRHEKTGAALLYFDRPDENKTFSVAFRTLPENDTGVFHILEHSVLNGSRHYPVKEPFVSLLQGSMQTFLNAMTFPDKTVFPVSSRNETDLFHLMSVYLDAVFQPRIYEKSEIFMQEGWHYEFDGENGVTCNGVVLSEMKGAFADVDPLMEAETSRLLFPDTCYGYVSGGDPVHIPELCYEQFLAAHRRFYHPSNACLFLDGRMDVDAALAYIDDHYLSHYESRPADFDFRVQTPTTGEKTVFYQAQPGEKNLAHMTVSKILCSHEEAEKIYAAKILARYLTGSNEAPLKRAFLARGLAQDVTLEIQDGVFQPAALLVIRNTDPAKFAEIRAFLPETVQKMAAEGLNRAELSACLERMAFSNREISEPYGVELALKTLDGWLYGDDPLLHVENAGLFDALRRKLETPYFETLLTELLGDGADKCYLYVLPSETKGEEDARQEAARVAAATAGWDEDRRRQEQAAFAAMQQWQQTPDSAEALKTLPHLDLKDVPETVPGLQTTCRKAGETDILQVEAATNGIVYLNLFFDVSDFGTEELRLLDVLGSCFGKLRTASTPADVLQTRIKAAMGSLRAGVELLAKPGDRTHCKPYLRVAAGMLEENVPAAMELLRELLCTGCYDEADRIGGIVRQTDYYLKQALIGSGHVFAITKALSPFSREGAMKELLEGESFVRWYAGFAAAFEENGARWCERLASLAARVMTAGRLFAGYGGNPAEGALEALIGALPAGRAGDCAPCDGFDTAPCAIEIPAEVGFSALGQNLYALGSRYSGSYAVLSSLMSFTYLWNAVRVRGGAYDTGMNVRANGDLFCYSYRVPNLAGTRAVYDGLADFLESYLKEGAPLDDLIIGAVNTTEPLLGPDEKCLLACTRHLRGITPSALAAIRRELLHTVPEDLKAMVPILRDFGRSGKFCAVGSREATAFIRQA